MSVGYKQRQKEKKKEKRALQIRAYERQAAMLQGQVGFLGMSFVSFSQMPLWARVWWVLSGRYDAQRAVREFAGPASMPPAAA